jgi:hypothetical protein
LRQARRITPTVSIYTRGLVKIVAMILSRAGQFFEERIINDDMGIVDAASLWEWITAGASNPLASGTNGLPTGGNVVYRGQANGNYNVSSSLHRLMANEHPSEITEKILIESEIALIKSMRTEGLGRLMTDGELMMVLQHHGIPTRLIDVSVQPLEALFFAVDSSDEAPGRLFVVEIHDATTMNVRGKPQLPWLANSKGSHRAVGAWTKTVALIDEEALDPRMRAQQGKFLIGGINRKYYGRSMAIDGDSLKGEEFPKIVSIGINFVRQRRGKRNANWPATGWNMRIEGAWKPELRRRLSELAEPITEDTMYPPVGEVKRLALNVLKGSLGS